MKRNHAVRFADVIPVDADRAKETQNYSDGKADAIGASIIAAPVTFQESPPSGGRGAAGDTSVAASP